MTVSYAEGKIGVERLVDRFASLRARNRRRYNEAATRQEFILPLFDALGWSIRDTREVSPEEQVSRGFVDFAFRIQGIPRFFLETKKIPANLDDPRWARQAINYSWLKGVTWAVLSDFEGLKIFNAEWQEAAPARAIFKDLDWDQYLDRFDDLWLLSRPAMEQGALDEAAEAVGKKVRRTPVNRLLLSDLTQWRRDLFRTLRAYNPKRPIGDIDQAVQRILDRLIFIRTVEDREIEPYHLLPLVREWRDRGRRGDLIAQLNGLFREFDAIYDTRLFARHLCEDLESEPAPFEAAIDGLYDMPGGYGFYDFNAIDADVLGAIYEQYLGHRAQDPEGKQAVDLRAKRKTQGIYYTPQFVVRYIMDQTLGHLLQERDYEQARQVKLLDMSCGSGSFLIEAFDVFDRYLASVRGQPVASAGGDTHDLARRMEILTSNLYGVDLDAQAVEIAQLNLLLKAVNQRGLLPPLENIRQGNSLISGTPAELEAAFGPDWHAKHPFNWEEEFPAIMERGGADVIVGNPPYIRIQTLPKDDVAWYGSCYRAASGSYDIYVLFVERALQLLRPGGVAGFILPNKFFQASYGKQLRALLSEQRAVWQVVDFGDAQVFEDATTYTCLLFLRKTSNNKLTYAAAGDWLKEQSGKPDLLASGPKGVWVSAERFGKAPWSFVTSGEAQVLNRLDEHGVKLSEITARNAQGVRTGANSVYVLRLISTSADHLRLHSKALQTTVEIERGILRPFLKGEEVKAYKIESSQQYLLYPYRLVGEKVEPLSEKALKERYPNAWAYLMENRATLEARDHGKLRGPSWYTFSRSQNLDLIDQRKLITPDIAPKAAFAFDQTGQYAFVSGYGIVLDPSVEVRYEYVLGLLNSRPLDLYLKSISTKLRGGFYRYFSQYVSQLPIRLINFDNPAAVARHDQMVALVEEMLQLQREKAEADTSLLDARHDLARRIERLDAEIDALVYELYELTGDEIDVVEGRS